MWDKKPAEMIVLTQRNGSVTDVEHIRAQIAVPLVLVTDKLPEHAEVALLKAGVELLVSRPYSARFLMAQIPALLRRMGGVSTAALAPLKQGPITLNPNNRTVQLDEGTTQHLSQLQFDLLYALMSHAGQTLSTEMLIDHVWGYDAGDKKMLHNLMWRLRRSVEPDPKNPRYILTVEDWGYTFRNEP